MVVAACSPAGRTAASGSASEGLIPPDPVTVVDATGRETTVDSVERIIPLDGDVAEVVFALGMGDRVVATDLSATYPPEADALPEIGYQRALSTEPIAAFEPTLILATEVAGPPEVLDELRQLGFPVVLIPNEATAQGAIDKIRAIATTLGVPSAGEELIEDLQDAIAAARVDGTGEPADEHRPRVLALYVRGSNTQLVLGESSATRWIIEAAGGIDVSTELGVDDPLPISAEAIVAAAPDVIVLPEAGLESVSGIDGLLSIPGLAGTPAGAHRRVLTYDDQLLLGNGPRVGALLSQLAADLQTLSNT
ncbi:MAG: hemin ABC transporter substrate-binding protein [Acidimicrobiales bacterium]